MYQNLQQNYLENEILTADPLKLVELLYRGAIDAIQAARAALTRGDIHQRSRQISKALGIVNELALSLDHSKGERISRELVELYDYMSWRLIEANTEQVDAPLVDVGGLLTTLLAGWQFSEHKVTAAPANRTAQAADSNYEPVRCTF